jgi:DNA-binding transcriptional ArsR family regulator
MGYATMRVHFTVEDLARLKMKSSLGPVPETVFALELFGRNSAVASGWRKHVREQLGSQVEEIRWLLQEFRPVPDLLWLASPSSGIAHGGSWLPGKVRRRVVAAVFEFCRVAVIPYQDRGHSLQETERDARGRIMITGGVEWLLSTVHPKLRWNSPVLEIPDEPQRDVYLNRRGLLMTPSLFLSGRSCVLIEPEDDEGMPVLAFSMPSAASVLSDLLWSEPNEQALAALVGHTRAAALQVLADSCTTGQLSERLGISLAGASKHATVLREAGLISTARHRNTALHTLTPLGSALLRSSNETRQDRKTPPRFAARTADAGCVGEVAV